jgi:hypothetical protein
MASLKARRGENAGIWPVGARGCCGACGQRRKTWLTSGPGLSGTGKRGEGVAGPRERLGPVEEERKEESWAAGLKEKRG